MGQVPGFQRVMSILADLSSEEAALMHRILEAATLEVPTRTPAVVSTSSLTQRERQVLERILAGQSSKAIGQALDLSYRTIENYRSTILAKLGCASTLELITKLRGTQSSQFARQPD